MKKGKNKTRQSRFGKEDITPHIMGLEQAFMLFVEVEL